MSSFTINSDSQYVVPQEHVTQGGAPAQQLYVDTKPRVTLSGGNVQLITD